MVPLTANWSWYHGGRGNFTTWLGLQPEAFYTDPWAIAAFKRYLDHLLDHVNPLTGTAYRNVTGAAFWSLFAHSDDHGYVQHDGFVLHYPGDNPDMVRHAAAIRAFGYAMAGVRRVPPVPAPGRPLITHLTRSGGTVTVTWRGATTAGAYTVQRAPHARPGLQCSCCSTARFHTKRACAQCSSNTCSWADVG